MALVRTNVGWLAVCFSARARAFFHLLPILAFSLLTVKASAAGEIEGRSSTSNTPVLLTTARQIVELPAADAASHHPVRIQGLMTYVDPHNKYGFIQDDTAGAVVFWTNATPPISAGQFVELSGLSESNIYSAVINQPNFQPLGSHEYPRARPTSFDDLFAGHVDCQWIELDGVVRSAATNADFLVLELAMRDHRVKISVLATNETDPERWVEARVLARGVACGSFNNKGQFVAAELLSPAVDHIIVVEGPHSDPYDLPIISVSTLGHKSEKAPGQRIHIRGQVTLHMPGEALFLRDGDASIEVRTSQHAPVNPGDIVDVIGFYERTESALIIADANFRVVACAPEPVATTVTVDQLNTGKYDAELVTISGRVLEWRHSAAERTVSLKANGIVFNARVDNGSAVMEHPAGSLVRVTGVCLIKVDPNLDVQSFEIHARSSSDLALLQAPDWWTTKHVLWLAGVLLVVGLLAAVWAGVLARSNIRLEEHVAQRTEALRRENAERQWAEAALRESQTLYLSLVEHLPVGIYRKDAEGRFTFANARYAESNGTTVDAIVGHTFYDLMPADIATAYTREDEQVLATGRMLEIDKEHRVPGREPRFLHVLKSPVVNAEGEVVGTQGTVTDITERKKVEAALAYERDLLRALLENSPDHIYFKDRDSRFIKCSQKQIERFGLDGEDAIVGKTDFNFFGEDHARAAFMDEQEIIRTGRPMVGKIEKESWKGGGKTTWVLTSKLPLRTGNGEVIGTIGISKDITDIKEAEAKLESIHAQLLDASRKAGMAEVATSVLHNVGNVLNSVNTSTSVLTDQLRASRISGISRVTDLLEQHRNDLPQFIAQEGRANQLIDYLKQLSTHLTGEQDLLLKELHDLAKNIDHIKEIVSTQQSYARVAGVVEKIEISSLIEDALRMHTGALARHHVSLVKRYDKVPEIEVDKHKVLQILVNLVSNAKYALADAPEDRKNLTVSVAMHGSARVRITVQDTGMGIAPENLTRIFSHGFTTRVEGHGFGLHSGALSAQEMGGSLTVTSDGPGKGATFTLELPLQPPCRPTTQSSRKSGFDTTPRLARKDARPTEVHA